MLSWESSDKPSLIRASCSLGFTESPTTELTMLLPAKPDMAFIGDSSRF
jgi:hypothetical protein